MRRALLPLLALVMAKPLSAQEGQTFPLAEVLALSRSAFAAEAAFTDALSGILPLTIERSGPLPTDLPDPFLWAISGSVGEPSPAGGPGAIFSCARYGLSTRDTFAERGMLDPEMFALMGVLQPGFDDATRWPKGAVARLSCDFVWDDARIIAILPRSVADGVLALRYTRLTDQTGPADIFGEAGFSLLAEAGEHDSVVLQDSAQVVLTLGHQQVRFRSYLMGGGM